MDGEGKFLTDTFTTIASPGVSSILVQGSKFIFQVAGAESEENVAGILRQVVRRYPDASHHCWAFRLGRPGDLVEKSYDAGEPSGTAGRPILDSLRHAGLENVACVVARYFGGTKLGTGGLARAYADAANSAIAEATLTTRSVVRRIEIAFDHSRTGVVYRALQEFGITLREGHYDDHAHGIIFAPASKAAELRERLSELTRNGVTWSERELLVQ